MTLADDAPWPAPCGPLCGGPPPGAADVWRVRLDGAEPDVRALPADEQARAARFLLPEPRRQFAATRGALRAALGQYLGIAPADVAFRTAAAGKPELASGGALRFNVSHTRGLALLAFARGAEIGVDVEAASGGRDVLALAARYFSAAESAELAALPPARRERGFLNGWTRKEAFVKALGAGVAFGLDRFAVSLAPDAPAELRWVADDPAAPARWRLFALPVGAGHAAALAVEASISAVRRFGFGVPRP